MELNEYQERAMATCMPSCDNFSYMMLNLIGEVGELASKVAKDIRKVNAVIGHGMDNELIPRMPFDEWIVRQEEYKAEAGDILWQLSGLCRAMDGTLRMWRRATLTSSHHAGREELLMAMVITGREQ